MSKAKFPVLILSGLFLIGLISPTSVSAASFHQPIGIGFTDVVPRQVVRASDDRAYIFAGAVNTNNIYAYWTNSAGLTTPSTTYSSLTQPTANQAISLEAAYNGSNIIVVLINTTGGNLTAYPFNVTTKTFAAPTNLETGLASTPQDVGTSGLSAMFDKNGQLHITYWDNSNHIKYRSYTYNSATNAFTAATTLFQVDTAGTANHPSLAISPVDGSVVVGWVSQATSPAKIQTRIKSANGVWGNVNNVSTAAVWTSPNAGLNIDQGPSIVIGTDGIVHLVYMQDYENPFGSGFEYGRSRYVTFNGSTWTDQSTAFFSHDPGLAITSTNQVFILGHGHPWDTGCVRLIDLCQITRNPNGTWQNPQIIAQAQGSQDFDASVSVKWGVTGWNRPDVIEFAFFSTPYDSPTLYYGQFTPTVTSSSSSVSSSSTTTTTTPAPTCTLSSCPQTDINMDHFVDVEDYGILVANFFKDPPLNPRADVNTDGIIDLDDYGLMVRNFLKVY